ncbi:calcium-binding protein [Sinorhizobium americanum]|uniref:calcium-binding protein n=1 Tax=Sinorhizobium americanum TaxID=194963 RepID=UPI0007D9448A|nr:hypothetical protein [Sinorhizobium americanum]
MINLDFTDLLFGDSYSYNLTTYRVQFSDGSNVYSGTGFTYEGGVPVSGTVTGIAEYDDENSAVHKLEGISISAASMVAAARTGETNDDEALILKALKGNDSVVGSEDGDHLFAGAGNDLIKGNGGDDTILSGAGADRFVGGTGRDFFTFAAVSDSTPSLATRDTILDFSRVSGNMDTIDLSAIDANTKVSGNQSFSFIGTRSFSGSGGELKYVSKASDSWVLADVNGDKKVDFAIHFDDAITFTSGMFWL